MPNEAPFIEAMAKHLPPSASDLHLLDVGGIAGTILQARRPDVQVEVASVRAVDWYYSADSFDAVVAYDTLLQPVWLAEVLALMRPGGRLIVVNPLAHVAERWVQTLEEAGYTRILVEPALDDGRGALIRGEKPHITADTRQRVGEVARRDADLLDLDHYRGRFVHLLVLQTPNKPVWRMTADDYIEWQAVAIQRAEQTHLLAFSSLPKAVRFMQDAVMQGFAQGINKVGKFSKETARQWVHTPLLNPTLSTVQADPLVWIVIDPATAEISDE
ncbi:MAG: class I SAM-dependent methyltransferase [Anaerolineae bacterium]